MKVWKARQAMLAQSASGDSKPTGASGAGTRGTGTAASAVVAARSRSGTESENKDDPSKEKEKVNQANVSGHLESIVKLPTYK